MSDNKLHRIGRAIVDADNISDLRAAGLDALAEAHRTADSDTLRSGKEGSEGYRMARESFAADVFMALGIELAPHLTAEAAIVATTALRAERDRLAARVAELEPALAEKHSHASGQEWEILLPTLGLTLRLRPDGVGVISAERTYTLWHPGATPSPFERGVLLSGDAIGLASDIPVLSVRRLLRGQT